MYLITKFLILIFLLLININYSQANEKIMFVDINYIFLNSIAGRDINNKIKLNFNDAEKKLKTLKNELIKNEVNIQNQKNILSKDEFNNKLVKLKNEIDEFNNQKNKLNSEINIYRNKFQSSFSKELSKIMQIYANDNDIDIIIDKNIILVGKNNFDATRDVLELFDKNSSVIKID